MGVQLIPPSVVLKTASPPWYRVLGSFGEIAIGAVHWKRCFNSAAPAPIGFNGQEEMSCSCPFDLSKRVINPSYEPAYTTCGLRDGLITRFDKSNGQEKDISSWPLNPMGE